jgi:hypothetical protein
MTTFTIDSHHNITAFGSAKEVKSNPEAARFSSVNELIRLAEKWPASRLVEIWNLLPGQKPVNKFTSRQCQPPGLRRREPIRACSEVECWRWLGSL